MSPVSFVMGLIFTAAWWVPLAVPPPHPDRLVQRGWLARWAEGVADDRVAAAGRATRFTRSGAVEAKEEFTELADGPRLHLTTRHVSAAGYLGPRPGEVTEFTTSPGLTIEVRRQAGGCEVSVFDGGADPTSRSQWRRVVTRPVPQQHSWRLHGDRAEWSARRVVWRGRPLVELLAEVPERGPDGRPARTWVGIFLNLDHPPAVRGRRLYDPADPARWLAEEVAEFGPGGGVPPLAAVERWATDRTRDDTPWRYERIEFTRFDRPPQPPDPALFTLAGRGLTGPVAGPEWRPASPVVWEHSRALNEMADSRPVQFPQRPRGSRWPLRAGAAVIAAGLAAAAWVVQRAVRRLDAG